MAVDIIDTMKEMLAEKNAATDMKEVALAYMKLAGGHDGIAKMLYDGYAQAIPGSLAHARYVDLSLELLKIVQPKDVRTDYANISEDDLERLLQVQLKKIGYGEAQTTASREN